MELRMRESYGKGLANHPGPELCGGGGDIAAEALARGTCRPGIELRNKRFGVPTLYCQGEGNTMGGVNRKPLLDAAES
jgi:RNA-directed DNA polymerase